MNTLNYVILVLITSLLGACAKGTGASEKKRVNEKKVVHTQEQEKMQTQFYSCSGLKIESAAMKCIEVVETRMGLIEEVRTWAPSLGKWNNLQLKTTYFRSKYRLTSPEEKCLERVLCDQPILWQDDY